MTIQDVNDHAPKFDSSLYKAKILKTTATSTRIVRVYAYDQDEGENARITYSFLNSSSLYSIDASTGFITLAGSLGSTNVSGLLGWCRLVAFIYLLIFIYLFERISVQVHEL